MKLRQKVLELEYSEEESIPEIRLAAYTDGKHPAVELKMYAYHFDGDLPESVHILMSYLES